MEQHERKKARREVKEAKRQKKEEDKLRRYREEMERRREEIRRQGIETAFAFIQLNVILRKKESPHKRATCRNFVHQSLGSKIHFFTR